MGVPTYLSLALITGGVIMSGGSAPADLICVPPWLLMVLTGFAVMETGTVNAAIRNHLGLDA